MRSGVAAVQNTLTAPAQNVLRHAIHNAQSRGHTHVQPLHVALVLLSHGGPLLRQACADLHPQTSHGLQQCHALELCFNVALDRLPQSSSNNTHPLTLSNALAAAFKRAQAHQKRGLPEQQQPSLVAVKVETEQLIISILEDPSVSRVMKEAGFVSQQVKTNLENAISLSSSLQQGNNQKSFSLDLEPPLTSCVEARPPMLPSPWIMSENTEDSKLLCCRECMSLFKAECEQLRVQDSAQVEVVVSPLPSWLQKEKDIKSEQEKSDSMSRKIQDLQQKWHLFCRTSHSSRDMAALGLLPFQSRMDKNISNNTGFMAANPTPMESVDLSSLPIPTSSQASVDFSSLPIPTPIQALNRPHWTCSLPPIAPSDGPRPIFNNAVGSKSQGLENMGKQVTLASNNKIGTLQLGGLKSIGSQPGPSPLSRLHANLPKSSTSDCPLRTSPLSSPLSAMKASKPLLKVNSPLAQKQLPSKPVATLSKNDNKAPVFFDQKAAERLKHVYKGVLEKVSWQSNAISQIATALVNTQSGMGKGTRADTWLLLLGPDQVGKGLVADALAELVMGKGKKPVCFGLIQDLTFSRWGRKEVQEIPRGPSTLDALAETLRTNPLSVLLLEDIDQADSVVRTNLVKAMETGKFMDSSARQVNVGNAIILMTSKVGTEDIKDSPFREDHVSLFRGARMKLTLELPMENKEVVFRDHNIRVVKDSTLAPVVDQNARKLPVPLKRKPAGFLKPAPFVKRSKLDLNLSAEENECQEESSGQEAKACNSDPVLSAAQQALSPRFFKLVDKAVVFEAFDMMEQANWILSQLSKACSSLECRNIEVDFQLMEHMVGVLWRTPGGNQAFETWVQEKLKACLNAFTAGDDVIRDRVLRFVYEDGFSKELCSASGLPLQIELGSR